MALGTRAIDEWTRVFAALGPKPAAAERVSAPASRRSVHWRHCEMPLRKDRSAAPIIPKHPRHQLAGRECRWHASNTKEIIMGIAGAALQSRVLTAGRKAM